MTHLKMEKHKLKFEKKHSKKILLAYHFHIPQKL